MKKILFGIITISIWLSVQTNAQSLLDKMMEVPVLSPQAASFAKYVEFPVSLYNGLATVGIPLYTIQSGDITVPISLSYHTGGIKVAEEASWVGLGWNLQAGGVISRQINGRDDFSPNCYLGNIFPWVNSNYDENLTNITTNGIENASDLSLTSIRSKYNTAELLNIAYYADGEPDTYMYNFGKYSGKFINTGDNDNGENVHEINRDNIQFIVRIDKITAITPDGYVYNFSTVEHSQMGSTPWVPTAYYLDNITSPTGKQITFQYTTTLNVRQLTTISEQFSGKYAFDPYSPCTLHSTVPSYTKKKSYPFSNPVTLKKIIFDEGYVDFNTDTREDMFGTKLNNIEVHWTDGRLFKKYTFTQSYFIGTSSIHYLTPDPLFPDLIPYPTDYLAKRLKLDALIEQSGTAPALTHQFDYYDGGNYSLPYKSSYATDFWGYYNGKVNNTMFIPNNAGFNLGSSWPTIQNYVGSNRDADSNYTIAGMLKQIIYPTKGWTTYQYSQNEYTNNVGSPTKYQWVSFSDGPLTDIGVGTKEQPFTLTAPRTVTMKVTLDCDCSANWCLCNGNAPVNWSCGYLNAWPQTSALYAELLQWNPDSKTYSIYKSWDGNDILACGQSGKSNSGVFVQDFDLPAGDYKMVVNYPDNKTGELGSKMAMMEGGYMEAYTGDKVGGGLRIEKITHHDPLNNVDLIHTYSYEGGLLMHFPNFSWRKQNFEDEFTLGPAGEDTPYTCLTQYYYDYLYSYSIIPYSSSANGSAVGYSKVSEIISDGQIGKTEYLYENKSDNFNDIQIRHNQNSSFPVGNVSAYAPSTVSTPHLTNGFLDQTVIYDKLGAPVKRTISIPQIVQGESFWAFKGDLQTTISNDGRFHDPSEDPGAYPPGSYFMYYFYPIQIGKVVPLTTIDQEMVNGVPSVQTWHQYEYNNNALLQSEKITNSDGKVSYSKYKYAKDYTSSTGWINDLLQKNMVDIPLETLSMVDNNVIGGSFVKYQTANGFTLPNEIYQVETASPKVIASSAPSAVLANDFKLKGTITYNIQGNIQTVQKTDNNTIIYLWGYNNLHPIAKIENASLSDIQSALGGSIPDFGSGGLTPTQETMLRNNTKLKQSVITTFSYSLLIGITSQTDSNGLTTHYEYDGMGRLILIKDNDQKILKQYEYHYQ